MFCSRKLNHRVSNIYERVLRLVCKDYSSCFDDLLVKDNFFRIQHRNLQELALEIFKVKINIAPQVMIMKDIFQILENRYSLRNETKFESRNFRMVRYGIETTSFVKPTILGKVFGTK